MRKTWKKCLAWMLTLLMVFTMIPASVFAKETEDGSLLSLQTIYVNPLYEDVLTEEDLIHSEAAGLENKKPTLKSDGDDEITAYYYAEDAAVEVREKMVQREETVESYYLTADESKVTKDFATELTYDILEYALAHTGVPDEGDYIMWQWGGFSAGLEVYEYEDEYLFAITYEFTYYTTLKQEQQVTAEVDELLEEFDLSDKDAYQSIKTVYDYICENVTYDYEHLNDEDYELQYTAYGALMDGTAVCQGYAVLLYRLALEIGMDCRLISGVGGGDAHGWNIIQMEDGLYYNADSTWDSGREEYSYFLLNQENFEDHVRDEEYDTVEFHSYYPMAEEDYVYIPPCEEHTWELVSGTEPTCTEAGNEHYVCTACGEEEDIAIDPIGHDYESVVTEPTCTEAGYTTYTCNNCQDVYVDEEVAALGHASLTEAVDNEDGASHHGVCAVCNEEVDEKHTFEGGICTLCGAVEVTTIEAPELLSIYSKVQDSAKATWTVVKDAEGYELWRATAMDAAEEEWTRVKTIKDGAIDRYTNQNLEIGTTYYYKVRAYKTLSSGEVVYSDYSEVKYMPAAVVFENIYSNSTSRLRILWKEINGAHGYQIWRKNDDGTWSIVKTLGDKGNELTNDQGSTTAYSNTGLEAGKTYTYKMRAFAIVDGKKIFGAYSDEYSRSVKPETPDITVTSPKAGRAVIEWSLENGAAGCQVWMSESPDGEFKIVKSVTDGTTSSYTKYDLTSGKTYYFKVRVYSQVNDEKSFSDFTEVKSIVIK